MLTIIKATSFFREFWKRSAYRPVRKCEYAVVDHTNVVKLIITWSDLVKWCNVFFISYHHNSVAVSKLRDDIL